MLGALIIVFREIIEAGLVVGIVLAATRGVPRRGLWVEYGILGGIAGACLVATFASSISAAMQGAGQELFNVTVLLIAVLMLAWHNVWMARHGREMAAHMNTRGFGNRAVSLWDCHFWKRHGSNDGRWWHIRSAAWRCRCRLDVFWTASHSSTSLVLG